MAFHLKLLLVAFLASLAFKHSLSAGVFLSIDCGSSDSYKDENGINWIGDDDFIQTGEPRTLTYSSASYPLTTMRVFSTRKKNCYTIKVDEGERILVRASFYYANYDDKSSPPVFDLLFDGNFWTTVNTTYSSYTVYTYETIYVVAGNSTSICVAQTHPGLLPFISALEVRSLEAKMYSQVAANLALRLIQRSAFGSNQTLVRRQYRYPNDVYDRTWDGVNGLGVNVVTSQASTINVTTDNSPPPVVLKNAVVAKSTSHIILLFTQLPKKPAPIYIATYFSEVLPPTPTQKRSFQLCIDNIPTSDPIIPPFGGASEVYVTNRIASASNSFTLQATSDSTLPPLLNAMEVYTVSDPLTNGTNSKDVGGLAALQSGFEVLQEWGGDPCLPHPYSWDWIECSTDPMPRVTALNLSGYALSGSLPDFSSMNALQTIDLSDNGLSGSIPDFLGTFPNLTLLNLGNNRFNGSIPTSLSSNKKLKLVVTNNCLDGMSCPPPSPPPPAVAPPTPSSTQTGIPPSPFPFRNRTPPTSSSTDAPPFPFQTPSPNFSGHSQCINKLAIVLGFSLVLSVLSRKF